MKKDPLSILAIKGERDWLTWVEEFASFSVSTKADLIEEALLLHAARKGFPKPAPPRTAE